jgi:membrane-bound ClpP family serine protease
MKKKNLAFGKINFILLAIGMLIIIIGFLLMAGKGTTSTTFEPSIFSARRIVVAPVVCLSGFLFMIYAIIKKPSK